MLVVVVEQKFGMEIDRKAPKKEGAYLDHH